MGCAARGGAVHYIGLNNSHFSPCRGPREFLRIETTPPICKLFLLVTQINHPERELLAIRVLP